MTDDGFAAELETAEIEARLAAMRTDLASGSVPAGMRRPLFDHEVAARTNFAGIEDDVSAEAQLLAARMASSRIRFVELVVAELRRLVTGSSPLAPAARVAVGIFDAAGVEGLQRIPQAAQLVEADAIWFRGRLEVAADRGYRRVLVEAAAQAFPVDDGLAMKLDAGAADHLDLLARRLAEAPHADVMRALRERVLVEPRDFVDPDGLVDRLDAHARGLARSTLEQYAGEASTSAHSLGRFAGAGDLPEARAWYASELLDRNTCGPCSLIDGHEYDSLADARVDYPHGIHRRCEGGPRCRGVLVVVWSSESEPTLDEPGDR